jgi:hypothetical protein
LFFAGPSGAAVVMDAANASAATMFEVRVQNIGKLKGDEVVQVYLLPQKVPLLKGRHPSKTLIGFVRVRDIAVGATVDAVFDITRELLLLATEDGDLASVPGDYELRVENGAGAVLSRPLTITGKALVVVVPFPKA